MINKITLMDFLSLENRKQKKNERSRQSGKSHHFYPSPCNDFFDKQNDFLFDRNTQIVTVTISLELATTCLL